MVANKKNQSLANKLVRAKIRNPEPIPDPSLQPKTYRRDPPPNIQTHLPTLFPRAYPMAKCKNTRCKICPKLRLTKTIFNKLCKVNIIIPKYKKPLTCKQTSDICHKMLRMPQSLRWPNNESTKSENSPTSELY